jgi:hypothetical protein
MLTWLNDRSLLRQKLFSFSGKRTQAAGVKSFLIAVVLGLGALPLRAQEAELSPIVVTGTFELKRTPSLTESFARHFEKEIEVRKAAEDAVARAPFFNARFWKYIPIHLESCSSDSSQFFTPSYLTSDYRNAARGLEESRKQSLFEP